MTVTDTPTEAPEAEAVDPYAFVLADGAVQETTFVRPPPVEADIPLPLRTICEKALVAAVPMRVKFPTPELANKALRWFRSYAVARTVSAVIPARTKGVDGATSDRDEVTVTGPVTIRANVQNDKVTVNFTVKAPYTPTPKPVIPQTTPTQ